MQRLAKLNFRESFLQAVVSNSNFTAIHSTKWSGHGMASRAWNVTRTRSIHVPEGKKRALSTWFQVYSRLSVSRYLKWFYGVVSPVWSSIGKPKALLVPWPGEPHNLGEPFAFYIGL